MAIYHASLKVFSRSQGHAATAAAAYRTGRRLHDERTGLTHDYRARRGVAQVIALAPLSAPNWATDVERLWSSAEIAETRVNARVARELEVALPAELNDQQRAHLARAIGQELVDRYNVAATLAIHIPGEQGDQRNFHVHILMTTRQVGPDGFGTKVRLLDDKKTGPKEVVVIRERVAELTNEHLARASVAIRVDHRSLNEQAAAAAEAGDIANVVRLAHDPALHEGKAATAVKRRGLYADRAEANRMRKADSAWMAKRVVAALTSSELILPPPMVDPGARVDSSGAGDTNVPSFRTHTAHPRRHSKAISRALRQAMARLAVVMRRLVERWRAAILAGPSPLAADCLQQPSADDDRMADEPLRAPPIIKDVKSPACRPRPRRQTPMERPSPERGRREPVSAYELGEAGSPRPGGAKRTHRTSNLSRSVSVKRRPVVHP